VELVAGTRTKTGLSVRAEWDQGEYPKGTKVSDEELEALPIAYDEWHGEWNYFISPPTRRRQTRK
jgi:hypothetical protein